MYFNLRISICSEQYLIFTKKTTKLLSMTLKDAEIQDQMKTVESLMKLKLMVLEGREMEILVQRVIKIMRNL